MRCEAKDIDELPCPNDAVCQAWYFGQWSWVCDDHNNMVDETKKNRRDLGAWKPTNQLLGIEFPEKRNRR